MSEERMDQQLADGVADGRISPDDAAEVQNFAAFLRESGPTSSSPDFDPKRFSRAYKKHYPEDYALAVRERQARGEP